MAKIYLGQNDQSKKVSKIYLGINGQAKKVKKAYIGVNDQSKLFYINKNIENNDYQQVQYIYTEHGTGYINLNLKPDDNTRLLIEFEFPSSGYYNEIFAFFGCYPSTAGYSYGLYARPDHSNSSNTFIQAHFCNSTYPNSIVLAKPVLKDTRYIVDFNNNNNLYLNNEYKGQYKNTITSLPNLYLLAENDRYDDDINRPLGGTAFYRIYHFKVWQSNNVIRDMYPCYNKNTNINGMYDIANNVFYSSVEGNFSVGPNI